MRVWVSGEEARQIRIWAIEEGWRELADRFYRAERSGNYVSRGPFLWRWRDKHPLVLRCLSCKQWDIFRRHRDARKSGWLRYGGYDWIHERCIDDWKKHGAEWMRERQAARERREAHDFLFKQPELLHTYKGVLVREAPAHEHTFFGVRDDLEAQITAGFGMERVRKVIDHMPDEIRENLVAAGFTGYHYHYHMLLAWVGSSPAQYRGTEFDDVRCTSVVVRELPKALRQRLPERLGAKL